MMLHIIHPHTYKGERETRTLGPIAEHTERDEKVSVFVRTALDNNIPVLCHQVFYETQIQKALERISFDTDPLFSFMLDERMDRITTIRTGIPLPDEKPEGVSTKGWDYIIQQCIRETAFKKKIGNHKTTITIGGVLEYCVSNFLGYYDDDIRRNGDRLAYIPAICAAQGKETWPELQQKLTKRNIELLTYDDAIQLINGV
jgi:hypothetical protein